MQNECEKNIHRIKTNIAHKKQPLVGVHIYQNPNETEKRVFSKDKNLLFDIAEGWKVVFLEDF